MFMVLTVQSNCVCAMSFDRLMAYQSEFRSRDGSPIYLDDLEGSESKLVGAEQAPNRRLQFAGMIVFEQDWFDIPDGDKYMTAKSIFPDGRFRKVDVLRVAAKAYYESLKKIQDMPEGRPYLAHLYVQREYDADKTTSAVRVWFDIRH